MRSPEREETKTISESAGIFPLSGLSITLLVGNAHATVFTFKDIQTLSGAIYVHECLGDDSGDVRKAVGAQGHL